jgi:hypothetical protein
MKALGYSPVPLYLPGEKDKSGKDRTKSPCFVDWSTSDGTPNLRTRLITKEEVAKVLRWKPYAAIGLVCGYPAGGEDGELIGIDIDTLDKNIQQVVLGAVPSGAPIRIGNPAKTGLLMFRGVGEGPAPNRPFLDKNGKVLVEVKGPGSQFFIPPSAYGPNSDYRMAGDKDIPAFADLPEFTPDDYAALLKAIAPYIKDKVIKEEGTPIQQGHGAGPDSIVALGGIPKEPPPPFTPDGTAEVVSALYAISPTGDNPSWFRICG